MDIRSLEDMNQALRERLAFIEFRLWFLGDVGRPDLMDRFGIAPAVATRDLAAYREVAPQNIDFDGSRKVYVPTAGFKAIFEHETDRVLSALSRGFGEGIGKSSSGVFTMRVPAAAQSAAPGGTGNDYPGHPPAACGAAGLPLPQHGNVQTGSGAVCAGGQRPALACPRF